MLTGFNACLQAASPAITYAFSFFPFSGYLLFNYTISEHIQKDMDMSMTLKTCISSINGSKTNFFLRMHIEFLFYLSSVTNFKMQILCIGL